MLLLNICNTELSGVFFLSRGGGTYYIFPCLVGQKILLGCGLPGGISTQADTMPERCHWHRSGVLVNFEHISHLVVVFLIVF